jgi:RsiW-degrading membrane proteinase PrsW (M82 family)
MVIPIGLIAQNVPVIAVYVFPPWHFLAAVIPPLGMLAFAARRLGATSGLSSLLTVLTWGALGATPIAVVLELATGALLFLFGAVVIALSPDSQRLLEQMQSMFLRTRGMLDTSAAMSLVTNPVVALGILFYFAGVVPLIEETLKTLVLVFIAPQRTRLQDAVLWGMAAGAGFAIIENTFNTTSVLSLWVLFVFTRLGATTMHVANGITMGRGWYAARVEGRWSRLFTAFLTSVFFHALWNGLAIALSASALYLTSNPQSGWLAVAPAGVLMFSIATALIVLAVLGTVWIGYSVRQVRESSPTENLLKGEILS